MLWKGDILDVWQSKDKGVKVLGSDLDKGEGALLLSI